MQTDSESHRKVTDNFYHISQQSQLLNVERKLTFIQNLLCAGPHTLYGVQAFILVFNPHAQSCCHSAGLLQYNLLAVIK